MTPRRARPPEPAGSSGRRPKRSLGQNFLVDPNLRRKIAAAAGAGEGDPVLEIGPGTGALTRHLFDAGAALTVVELDDHLAGELAARYRREPRVRVVHGDILTLDLPGLTDDWTATRVLGNIPYNITTPIIFKLLRFPFPADIVITVQAEVGARILAGPGSRTYGALSVGVAVHAKASRVCRVPRGAFRPVPGVDSVALRITPHSPQPLDAEESRRVRALTRAAFSWRRKQMGGIMRRHPDLGCPPPAVARALEERSLPPAIRPEQLSPEDFIGLSRSLAGAFRV